MVVHVQKGNERYANSRAISEATVAAKGCAPFQCRAIVDPACDPDVLVRCTWSRKVAASRSVGFAEKRKGMRFDIHFGGRAGGSPRSKLERAKECEGRRESARGLKPCVDEAHVLVCRASRATTRVGALVAGRLDRASKNRQVGSSRLCKWFLSAVVS